MSKRDKPSPVLAFWNDADQVETFAAREPDHRLVEILQNDPDARRLRVLDVGCAGGRNTEYLARAAVDVVACDLAPAMVERTRSRLIPLLGPEEARRHVHLAPMDALSFAAEGEFDLVIGLGVYQQAQSEEEFDRSLSESARVLRTGGRCLVATFAPGTGPIDAPPERVPGTRFLFGGFRFGNACLLSAEQLDAEFARHGLEPLIPSYTVEKQVDGRNRNTVNALYVKAGRA
jgi:SAM-dependent methyltransferase